MKIHDYILDDKNSYIVNDTTIGAMIASSGKKHLWDVRTAKRIDTLVVHNMSAVNIDPGDPYNMGLILKIFCDYGVSCHYYISRGGEICRLVPEEAKAWHCGPSIMPDPDNRTGVNDFSIGIELAATEDSGFTAPQYDALRWLCADVEERHGVRMARVGHDQIAGARAVALGLRTLPKTDPGPLFDWNLLTQQHISVS